MKIHDPKLLNCNFVDLYLNSLYQIHFIPKVGSKRKYCLVYMVLDIKLAFEFSEYSH